MSDVLFKKMNILADSTGQQVGQAHQSMQEQFTQPMVFLIILGAVILTVWIFSVLIRPKRFTLCKTPGRPNHLNPIHIIAVFFLWQGFAMGISKLISLTDLPGEKSAILGAVSGQIIGIILSLVVASMCFRNGLKRGLGLSMRHWLYDTGRGIVGYLAILPICMGLVFLCVWLMPEEWQTKHSLLVAIETMGPLYKTLIAISAVLLAPLLEETFFRGLLQSMLRRYISPWLTIVIASAIFACVHAQLQNLPALFALGIALGYNYERSGRLWPVILMHMLFNGVTITIALTK